MAWIKYMDHKTSVKTSTLSDPALNFVIATILGHQWRCRWMLEKEGFRAWVNYEEAWGNPTPDYCKNFEHSSLIIDEHIDIIRKRNAREEAELHTPDPAFRFKAEIFPADGSYICAHGPTLLVAAMRCFVSFKLGDYVELPNELLSF